MARKSDSDIALATSSSVSLKSKGGIEISVHEVQRRIHTGFQKVLGRTGPDTCYLLK